MRLRKLEWNDPILKTYEITKNKIAQNRTDEFDAAYRRYALKRRKFAMKTYLNPFGIHDSFWRQIGVFILQSLRVGQDI